ncbi:MAG: flavin reductase family protein [Lachnospiraceae bacterium]|nr:flavin reductase family protein [Lachnospiraceae bacterium]
MHTFQPMNIKEVDINPFNMIGSDWFALTATDGETTNSMTAGWGGFGVMWGMNVALVVVRDSRFTREIVDKADTFSMTFFNMDKKENRVILKYLGGVSGRDEDKIKNASLEVNYHEGTPFLDAGNLVYTCRKLSKTKINPEDLADMDIDTKWYSDKDYHNLYIAEITGILAR